MNSKKGAMEMSVGTIVTIVLLMSVLVLGIFLVQKVFQSGTGAVDAIDDEVQNEIAKLFSEEGKSLAIFPNSRDITLKKGNSPKGFAFSINNKDTETATFNYLVYAEEGFDFTKCGSTMNKNKADSYILLNQGTINLGPGNSMEIPEIIKFQIPETAPPCTIPYRLEIDKAGVPFPSATVFVTIK
jgi:hypothetical protein